MSKTITNFEIEIAKLKKEIDTLVKESFDQRQYIKTLENELTAALLKAGIWQEKYDIVNNYINSIPAILFINEAWLKGKKYYLRNIYANKTAYDYTGYTRSDCDRMNTRFARDVIHPDHYKISMESYLYMCKPENREKMFGGPYQIKIKNGEYIWGIGYAMFYKYLEDSGHCLFMNCFIPITEAMQLDEQVQSLIAESRKKGKEFIKGHITIREMEVLVPLVQGRSSAEIGDKLFISERTVDTHKQNIMRKLDLHSMAALVFFARQNGII